MDDDQIEICAQLCDAMVKELTASRKTARKSQYDRQSPRQIDYAIRAVARLGERIRALKSITHTAHGIESDADKLASAIAIAKELLPIIAKTRDSAWKHEMVRRLSELIG